MNSKNKIEGKTGVLIFDQLPIAYGLCENFLCSAGIKKLIIGLRSPKESSSAYFLIPENVRENSSLSSETENWPWILTCTKFGDVLPAKPRRRSEQFPVRENIEK